MERMHILFLLSIINKMKGFGFFSKHMNKMESMWKIALFLLFSKLMNKILSFMLMNSPNVAR